MENLKKVVRANSCSSNALPGPLGLDPQSQLPGWLGRSDSLLLDAKGKCCHLPAFKPAMLLLSMKSARQDFVMGRQKGRKQGMGSVQKPSCGTELE